MPVHALMQAPAGGTACAGRHVCLSGTSTAPEPLRLDGQRNGDQGVAQPQLLHHGERQGLGQVRGLMVVKLVGREVQLRQREPWCLQHLADAADVAQLAVGQGKLGHAAALKLAHAARQRLADASDARVAQAAPLQQELVDLRRRRLHTVHEGFQGVQFPRGWVKELEVELQLCQIGCLRQEPRHGRSCAARPGRREVQEHELLEPRAEGLPQAEEVTCAGIHEVQRLRPAAQTARRGHAGDLPLRGLLSRGCHTGPARPEEQREDRALKVPQTT
mmetsp:Transcript_19967/g.60206  ORF Transcript_19967/g.60206 Transcript_19967/m.60206 type:complete len:275 (+) Transcript_19967:209-1033(+)